MGKEMNTTNVLLSAELLNIIVIYIFVHKLISNFLCYTFVSRVTDIRLNNEYVYLARRGFCAQKDYCYSPCHERER